MRLAFYTYSYTDRLELPLEPCLRRIAETGYDGIDVSGTHGKSEDPNSVTAEFRRQTRRIAEELELAIEAVITHAELTTSLATDKPLDLKGSVDLAVELGAPVVTFHMGGQGDADRGVIWDKVVSYVRSAARYAEARHVQLAVDGIWPTWITDTPESMLKLFDDVDSGELGVNFDPCYLTLMGLDPVEVARQWGERMFHAHLKDHEGTYPKFEHRIPGQGAMDYPRIVKGLKELNFDRAMAIECFTDMKLETACDVGYATLHEAMEDGP